MRFVIFSHSLVSDWNHGNAHFLRGIGLELVSRGFEVQIFEPRNGWSRQQLLRHYGHGAILEFERTFPGLRSTLYDLESLNLDHALDGADVVLVHEWNDRELVARIGEHHLGNASYRLYFHDTHHRAATAQASISSLDLSGYDGVLAYGGAIAELYRRCGWASQAWTWHEAADTRTFYPRRAEGVRVDVGWIGNWGDDERAEELREFFIRPVAALRLKACVYGVRYPLLALREFIEAGIQYYGWIPNYRVPGVFARCRVTIHVPRRPYASALPGIPTIRPFEALACGIPLISAPWSDSEGLFRPGSDFLFARDGAEMTHLLREVLSNSTLARSLAEQGLETIRSRHTCAHRVDELLSITRQTEGLALSSRSA